MTTQNESPETLGEVRTAQLLKVLLFIGLTLFLFAASAGVLLVEGLSSATLPEIASDPLELPQAQALSEQQAATLAALRKETTALEDMIANRRRTDETSRANRVDAIAPTIVQDPRAHRVSQSSNRLGDPVREVYVAFESRGRASEQWLEKLNEQQRAELGSHVINAMRLSALPTDRAIAAVHAVGNEQQQAEVVRIALSRLEQMEFADIPLTQLLDMCRQLDENQRADAITRLLHNVSIVRSDLVPQVIRSIPETDMPQVASLLAHPMPAVRDAVRGRMSEDQMWAATLPAIAGKDYAMFAEALKWIRNQEPNDKHRAAVVSALRDILWFRDVSEYSAFEAYQVWADESESANIVKLLSEPTPTSVEAEAIVRLAKRVGIPSSTLVKHADGAAEQHLFNHYLSGDESIEEAVLQMLKEDGSLSRRVRWMKWISESGKRRHLAHLETAASHTHRTSPNTVLANQVQQLFDSMSARLSEK